MLFFKSKKEKEEIQDKIDDMDMAIYRRKCDLENAKEKHNPQAVEQVEKKIKELEKKRKS